MSQRRGVAYIEYARTPALLRYREFNVHKGGTLLIAPAISVTNALEDYGVNA